MMLYDARKKSVLVAYLLLVFLGFLGGHRFYLGRVGSGIAVAAATMVSLVLTLAGIGYLLLLLIGLDLFVDLIRLDGVVRRHNERLASKLL